MPSTGSFSYCCPSQVSRVFVLAGPDQSDECFEPHAAHAGACYGADVIVTPHLAFLTTEALLAIAETTVQNLAEFAEGKKLTNEVQPER